MTTVLLALMIAAPAPAGDHPLMGKWVVESHTSSGRPIIRPGKPERITITRDRWKIGAEGMTESCLTIDTMKNPPRIDIWVPAQGDDDLSVARGIYNLKSDTLTVCYRLGRDRPTKFESLPKSGNYLIVLKRVND